MSDHHDAQDYTANGPSTVGFRTGGDGTGIALGVNATGTQYGVHGIGAGTDGSNADTCGVFGESLVGVGVRGISRNDAGVVGISDDSTGVKGLAEGGDGVEGSSDSGVGVRGASSRNDGVVGSTSVERRSGVFGFNTQSKGAAFGVSGSSESPQGAGINGFSDAGVGVLGSSRQHDGVVGSSGFSQRSGVFGFNTLPAGVTFGVSGRSDSPHGAGVHGFSDSGIGVQGSSRTNDGVVGSSGVARKSGVFGFNTLSTGAAYGVSGRSDSADGAGVNGFADHGYGGRFSGGRAPLRLLPAGIIGRPTTGNHQVGELFVDKNGDLFICRASGTPGDWFRVQLTPA